mgnify:CR=1 FL=1
MRFYIETTKLTNDDLRLLATKTGKSIRTLKRLKQTSTYLMYSLIDDYYDFIGYSHFIARRTEDTREQFFKEIEQHQLLGFL